MKYNEWLFDKPEITEDCLMIVVRHWECGTTEYDLFELYLDGYLKVIKDDCEWGDYNELRGDRYFLIKI